MLLVSPVKIDCPEQGRSIVLINTPERNPDLGWNNILTMLNNWLVDEWVKFEGFVLPVPGITHFIRRRREKHKGFKLSGILYLHPITRPVPGEVSFFYPPPLEIIEKILGKKVAENVLFVTTMWDKRADEDEHRQMELTFQAWSRKKEQYRVDRFDNTATTAWRLIDRLLTGN